MYTTTIKRFIRRFNFKRKYNNEEIKLIYFYKKLFKLIKDDNEESLCNELIKYIEMLNYKGKHFDTEEKAYITKTIKIIFQKNKKKYEINKVSSSINIISLSGFGYSGTGAIHDFLRDIKNTIDVLKGRELDLFKYQYSLYSLYLRSISNRKNISEKDLNKFLFNHFFGLPYPGGVTQDEINNRLVGSKSLLNAVLRLPQGKERVKLIKDICIFANNISDLNKFNNSKEKLELISKNLINNFGEYYKSKYPKKEYIILNNWITASSINMVNLLPSESTIIICTRDALDAFYSWYSECPRIKFNLKIFVFPYVFLYFIRHIDFSRNYRLICKERLEKVHFIYFEEFVFKTSKKNGDLFYKNLFKLVSSEKSNFLKFNPNKSKNNVNIFLKNSKFRFFKISSLTFNSILYTILRLLGCWNYRKN